jgi:heme/copper-type cytochrome/quinol oxidase subunit 2
MKYIDGIILVWRIMQEMEQYCWDTLDEKEEEITEEVGFWTNILATVLSISWMVTIFFYCCVSGSAPALHIDVGAQIAPYLGMSGILTAIWLLNKIYSSVTERRTINPRQRRGHL